MVDLPYPAPLQDRPIPMGLPRQTGSLLRAARTLVESLPADAVLLVTETDLDWDAVRAELAGCRLLVAAEHLKLQEKLQSRDDLLLLDHEPIPVPSMERLSISLLKAISAGHLQPGAEVVVVYNGIGGEQAKPEPIDTLSIIHLGEHLERLTAHDLRQIETDIPLETLRLAATLASEVGREGREGKPVGTIIVVGDTRKVLSMCRPINFNPFRGYAKGERDLRERKVREQIKDIAQLDGAILIDKAGVAVAACLYLEVGAEGINVSKGFGSRHWAGAAISRKTDAIAFVVSQSSGTVRVFQDGEVVMHIEPLARPHVWQPIRLEARSDEDESDGAPD